VSIRPGDSRRLLARDRSNYSRWNMRRNIGFMDEMFIGMGTLLLCAIVAFLSIA
jgi:hypothetical protein